VIVIETFGKWQIVS